MTSRATLTGAALSLGGFGLFAGVDVSVKVLGGAYNPFQIIFFVSLMTLPVAIVYAMAERAEASLRPRRPGLMALRAGLVVVNGICGTYAFSVLPLAQCYAIFFTMPIFIALLAVPVLKERIDLLRGLAVGVGLLGVVVALEPGRAPLQAGHLAALAGSVAGAANYVLIRLTGGVERVAVLQLYPLLAQLAVAAAVLPFVHVPMAGRDLALAGAMGVASFAGYLLVIAAYRRAPVIVVAPMQYSQILWGALWGALLFDEAISRQTLLGTVLIIVAGALIVARRDSPRPGGNPPPAPAL